MEAVYKDVMEMALSANDIELKILFIEENWSLIEENSLLEYARIDEVSSHIAHILINSKLDFKEEWLEDYKEVESRISLLMIQLEDVAGSLKNNNIEIVALKNAGITKGIYKNNACSPMGDIDLLVRSNDFRKAHEIILNELNFTFKFRSEFEEEDLEDAFRGGGTEYFKDVDGYRVWLELQWRPIAGRWIQPHNEPNGDELMDNSIEIEGSAVRILAPEDNLLQVSLHTAKHSYVRAPGFRLHSDVDRIVRFQEINWEIFTKKVIDIRLKTAVYYSLFYGTELLDTPIPKEVLKELKPIWFRRLLIEYFIKKADFYNQKKKKFSKLGYIIFNLALYDSISENLKAFFPSFESIKIKYPINNKWQLPYFYVLRFKDLLFKRAKL